MQPQLSIEIKKKIDVELQVTTTIQITKSDEVISTSIPLIEGLINDTMPPQIITNIGSTNNSSTLGITTFLYVKSVQMSNSLDFLNIQLNGTSNEYNKIQNFLCRVFIKDLTKLGGISLNF